MYLRVGLLNVVEPWNDVVRCAIVCGDVEVVSMDMKYSSDEHFTKLCQNHDNREEFFVTNSVSRLSIVEFAGPEGLRFVVLDNVGSHLIAGGISVSVK